MYDCTVQRRCVRTQCLYSHLLLHCFCLHSHLKHIHLKSWSPSCGQGHSGQDQETISGAGKLLRHETFRSPDHLATPCYNIYSTNQKCTICSEFFSPATPSSNKYMHRQDIKNISVTLTFTL